MTDAAYVLHQQAVELINRQTNYLAQQYRQLANDVQSITIRLQSTPSLDMIERAFRAHKDLEEQIKKIYILVQTELDTAHKEYQQFIQISKTLNEDTTKANQAISDLEEALNDYDELEPSAGELIDNIKNYDISKKGTYLPRAVNDAGATIESPSEANININLIPKADDNTKRTLVFGETKIHNDGTADKLQITELTTSSIQAVDNEIELGDSNSTITVSGIMEISNLKIDEIELGNEVEFTKNVTFTQEATVTFKSKPEFDDGANINGDTTIAGTATITTLKPGAISLPHNISGSDTSEIKRVLTEDDYTASPSSFIDSSTGALKELEDVDEDTCVVTYGFLRKVLENYSGGSINSIISAIYKLDKSIYACLTKSSNPEFEDIPSSISDWIKIDAAIKTCARNMEALMTRDDVDLTDRLEALASDSVSYTDKQSATIGVATLNTIGKSHMIASLASNQSKIFTSSIE